jgi:hypothetical protein
MSRPVSRSNSEPVPVASSPPGVRGHQPQLVHRTERITSQRRGLTRHTVMAVTTRFIGAGTALPSLTVSSVQRVADIPSEVPSPVRQAVAKCAQIEDAAHSRLPWGEWLGVLVVFSARPGENTIQNWGTVFDPEPGSHSPVGLLYRAIHNRRQKLPAGFCHIGAAVLSEGLTPGEGATLGLSGSPPEVRERHDDLVAAGQARQFRTAVGAMASGWRFEVRRERHGTGVEMGLFAPGEPWAQEHELAVAITHANETLMAR